MNKQVESLKANFEDLQTIWEMQVEAFSELYEKYHDTETSPATEKIEKLGYHQTGKTEVINDKMTIVFYEKD